MLSPVLSPVLSPTNPQQVRPRSARTVLVYIERRVVASGAKIKGKIKLILVPLLLPSPVVVQHARLGKPPFWHRE